MPSPLASALRKPLSNEQAVTTACNALVYELGCQIEKILGCAITARRPSGLSVIVRQKTLKSYAYNIFDPNGNPVSRVDSSDHHDVAFGPDHLHRNLQAQPNGVVEPSFTYGLLVADLRLVRSLLEDAEREWTERST